MCPCLGPCALPQGPPPPFADINTNTSMCTQVLAALRGTDVPVPRALCLATNASIIGTPFYVMEHVQVNRLIYLANHRLRVQNLALGCRPSQPWNMCRVSPLLWRPYVQADNGLFQSCKLALGEDIVCKCIGLEHYRPTHICREESPQTLAALSLALLRG